MPVFWLLTAHNRLRHYMFNGLEIGQTDQCTRGTVKMAVTGILQEWSILQEWIEHT